MRLRRSGELDAVIMDRLWQRGSPALVRDVVEDLRRDRALAWRRLPEAAQRPAAARRAASPALREQLRNEPDQFPGTSWVAR